MKSALGFTLIELLVVIAIISILSAIGITVFNGVSKKARDAKNKADIDAITKAYEVHYDPSTGNYPPLQDSWFAAGQIPTPERGFSLTPAIGGFQVCTTLEDSSSYCQESSQVRFIAVATAAPTPTSSPTAGPTSTPAPTPTTLVSDSFNRTNSNSLGNTDTGQPWIIARGEWGISGNSAYPVNGCPAPGFAVVDAGISDATIKITLSVNLQDAGIPFRFVDSNNTYSIDRMGGSPAYYRISKKVGGAVTQLAATSIAPADGDNLKIVLDGTNIKLYVNETLAASAVDNSLNGTKFGIGTWCNGSIRFDDFSVSTNPIPTPYPSFEPVATDTSYDMKVLVLKYFPLTEDGQNIDINVTGDVGDLYSVIRQRTIDVTEALRIHLEKSTSYLGYSNPSAPSALRYQIVNTYEYTQAVPFDPTTRRPLYDQILTAHNICDYVNNQGVNEVWMWAYQGPTYPGSSYPYLNISESKMSGPFGDISNSYRGNDMPLCDHTYRLYVFNYNSGTGSAMHSWGHQMEAEMSAVDSNLWSIFQGPHNGRNSSLTTRCGDVHSPPNASGDYDYRNTSSWNSDCLDWNPDGLGNTTSISCTTWSCSDGDIINNTADIKYFVWMWQNMPGRNNPKSYQGKQLRNWWDVHGDFDNVMGNSRRLTVQ
ncbi:prepilin-type N-terminal cleavage/methylation domain-containing protein [Candidatus Daviesbacteria bacterium]|nr:prepilin-type N-terminal cleavage/methylation domain-containing protein [Candidatus Daviesbacteria bacterium]